MHETHICLHGGINIHDRESNMQFCHQGMRYFLHHDKCSRIPAQPGIDPFHHVSADLFLIAVKQRSLILPQFFRLIEHEVTEALLVILHDRVTAVKT